MKGFPEHRTIYRNAVDVIPREELDRRLAGGETLRVKLGIDPTAPDIHLGFAVVLRELRAFQDLGHTAVLVIGDYTARVGDPSGRSKTRPILSPVQIEENTRTYLEPDQLRALYPSVAANDRVIVYCGGGIAATANALSLVLAGRSNVGVYDGSLAEWAADPFAPLATG